MAKYTKEFKQEVIQSVNTIGFTETWKKYTGLVYPDTIKRWVDPKEAEKARLAANKFHETHKTDEQYKEKKRKSSELRRNTEEGKAYMDQYRIDNEEQIIKNIKRHRNENLTHYLQRQKDWYYANTEKADAAQKKDYKKNKKKYHARELNRYHNDPITKIKHLTRCRFNQLIKKGKAVKTRPAVKYLGDLQETIAHIEKQFKPGMTWENHGTWHADHIKPLSSFDLSLEENRHKAFHYTNLQPLWKVENLQKASKVL